MRYLLQVSNEYLIMCFFYCYHVKQIVCFDDDFVFELKQIPILSHKVYRVYFEFFFLIGGHVVLRIRGLKPILIGQKIHVFL